MTTMNVSLPEKMKEFVDRRVEAGGYQTVSEYVRDLIRKDIERLETDRLDALLLEGIRSIEEEGTVLDSDEYWIALQERIRAGEFRKRKMQTA